MRGGGGDTTTIIQIVIRESAIICYVHRYILSDMIFHLPSIYPCPINIILKAKNNNNQQLLIG